ncbi:hypothetical protein U1Q18_037171 [Sarracenia purpurea var. burkii]
MKKGSSTFSYNKSISKNFLPSPHNTKSRTDVSCKDTFFQRADQPAKNITALTAPSGMDVSPSKSDPGSVSLDESMSTSDSLRSLEFEYIDNYDDLAVNSIERKACSSLSLSDHEGKAGDNREREIRVAMETSDRVVGIDNGRDPQLCATIACDIYKNLRASEREKRPCRDYLERVQTDINASMRAILIDWLVEVLQMESAVLNYLKFEMTALTARCFLRRFVRAAQGTNEVPSMQLEYLASYVTELSLLEYSMLCYAPSLIAASATFLAKFILNPSKRPWTLTLMHYTLYKPSDMCDCVKAMHRPCFYNYNSSLPAIREKYSQHKYKFVAKKKCPSSIPQEFFCDLNN